MNISMYLVDLLPLVGNATSLEELLEWTEHIWTGVCEDMEPEESLWIFAPSVNHEAVHWPVAMALADFVRNDSDLSLKNIISRYQDPELGGELQSSYEEILFLVKDKHQYQFNKNEIRIEHVYQGKEWTGEREKGRSAYHDSEVRRYNPDGKDPGNVWLSERRDVTSDQTIDETYPLPRREALRRCLRAGSSDSEEIHSFWIDEGFKQVVAEEGRQLVEIETQDDIR
jgi:hypothetical protein